ncbi:hypothetical protein Pan241w_56820 [Gimesia alba]|uniref:Uncharacterized protein n=1 Tax=Gimesia alba TaxID=2527973 RepID=A0A517RNU6_9PLAN|nr:hypothetical protein [Gimesia alba]QDT45556.1 hypothetical protein Pan241w_56820 [Gimesia alba]
MISLLQSKRKTTRFERVLWISVGLITFLPLSAVLMENPSDVFSDSRMAYLVFFGGIATSGILCNWGPIIPCTILGMGFLMIFTDPISSTHQEAVFKEYIVPMMGAISGAIIGLMIDWNLTSPSTIKQNPNDIPEDVAQQFKDERVSEPD